MVALRVSTSSDQLPACTGAGGLTRCVSTPSRAQCPIDGGSGEVNGPAIAPSSNPPSAIAFALAGGARPRTSTRTRIPTSNPLRDIEPPFQRTREKQFKDFGAPDLGISLEIRKLSAGPNEVYLSSIPRTRFRRARPPSAGAAPAKRLHCRKRVPARQGEFAAPEALAPTVEVVVEIPARLHLGFRQESDDDRIASP